MTSPSSAPASFEFVRQLADQAFARSAGAPLVGGNAVTPLFDCTDNFPAWEAAIAAARECIYIEMYIFSADAFGTRLRDALAERARAGVRVCLLYDWLGCWKEHLRGFFRPIVAAGGQTRAFNPPSLGGAASILGRNHRKLIVVDGRTAFVGGLCVSSKWEGDARRGIAPWRDTGVRLEGPIVRDAVLAFADSWAATGAPLPAEALPAAPLPAGPVEARLIATTPDTANMMRLDLLIASFARRTLWLSDAYFMASGLYLTALKHAAQDGVDVRLLVPRSSDIGWIATVSRTLYRPLLLAGVRVYEWDGPMMHGKTAVADGRWARIGSTNLNYSSWISNREVDVAIEDSELAGELAERFLKDLENATEIVLSGHKTRPVAIRHRVRPTFLSPHPPRGHAGAAAAVRQAARLGDALGAVVRGTRTVDLSEAAAFFTIGLFFIALALLAALFPYLVAAPLALLSLLSGGAITLKALNLFRARRRRKRAEAEADARAAAAAAPADEQRAK